MCTTVLVRSGIGFTTACQQTSHTVKICITPRPDQQSVDWFETSPLLALKPKEEEAGRSLMSMSFKHKNSPLRKVSIHIGDYVYI